MDEKLLVFFCKVSKAMITVLNSGGWSVEMQLEFINRFYKAFRVEYHKEVTEEEVKKVKQIILEE